MLQYLKLTAPGSNKIVYPPEITCPRSEAVKAWGEDGFVEHDIKATDHPRDYGDELEGGAIAIDSVRVAIRKAEQDARDLDVTRAEKIKEISKGINTDDFDITTLTSVQLKCAFKIGGTPTDEELGI